MLLKPNGPPRVPRASDPNDTWPPASGTPPPDDNLGPDICLQKTLVHITTLGDNRSGQVSADTIKLQGPVVKATISDAVIDCSGASSPILNCVVAAYVVCPSAFLLENDIDVLTDELEREVFCLPMVHYPPLESP